MISATFIRSTAPAERPHLIEYAGAELTINQARDELALLTSWSQTDDAFRPQRDALRAALIDYERAEAAWAGPRDGGARSVRSV